MPGLQLFLDAKATRNLMDRKAICAWLQEVAELSRMTILGMQSHMLPTPLDSGPGVTAVAVIAESHIAVHSWPEHGVVTLDFYSCRPFDARAVSDSFVQAFGVTELLTWQVVERFGYSEHGGV